MVSIIESTSTISKPEWGPQYPEQMPGTGRYNPVTGKAHRVEKKIEKQWHGYIEREYEKQTYDDKSRNKQLKASSSVRSTRLPSLDSSFSKVSKRIARTDEVHEIANKFILNTYITPEKYIFRKYASQHQL